MTKKQLAEFASLVELTLADLLINWESTLPQDLLDKVRGGEITCLEAVRRVLIAA